MERLLFPYLTYTAPPQSLFPKKINTGFIYTMNANEEQSKEWGCQHAGFDEWIMQTIFGDFESLSSFDTYQFEDYSKVIMELFDPEKKAARRKEIFPNDCEKAYQMGVRFATGNK